MKGGKFGKRISESSFFAKIRNKANEYLKNPEKLNDLIDKATKKAESKSKGHLSKVWDSLMTFFRLLRAYAKREYTKVPWQSMVLIVATIIYFLIPSDLIPDVIVGLGFIDDAALIGFTMKTVKKDIDEFLDWENRKE